MGRMVFAGKAERCPRKITGFLPADIRHLHELLHPTTQLWNLAQPDTFHQNEMNQVQRFSTTNEGPGVNVAETVNSDPASWINNGSGPNTLSKQVFQQYGQSGYAASPTQYKSQNYGPSGSGQGWYEASTHAQPTFIL